MTSILSKCAAKFPCRRLVSKKLSTKAAPKPERIPKVIFSGIQPTGIPHLGNYLGALQAWVRLQDVAKEDTKLLYSLVDLHAITVKQDPAQLRQWKKESLAALLAIGLDAERSTIFFQSDVCQPCYRPCFVSVHKQWLMKQVPAHSELMWILSCNASMGYLSRMTQWKSKISVEEKISPFDTPLKLGLFSYPVLQAADILIHRYARIPDKFLHILTYLYSALRTSPSVTTNANILNLQEKLPPDLITLTARSLSNQRQLHVRLAHNAF
jgi:tryptophanyl-tRNA synthetase